MSDDTKPTLVPNPLLPDAPAPAVPAPVAAAAPAAPAPTGNYFDKYDPQPGAGNYFDKYDLPPGVERRSALGEIANQLKAGLISDLPKMAGQAIQYTSDPGRPVYEIGKSIADYGRAQAARPDLQPQEVQHGTITNALAGGARMLPQSIIPAAAVGLAATGVGLPESAALLAGSVLGAAPAGMSQGQDTLEKARAKGLSEAQALAAARETMAEEWVGESLGEYAGGKLFGLGGHAITSKLFGHEAGTAAEQALAGATSTKVAKPFLHQLGETAAVETGTEMGQNAAEAYTEQRYGIDNQDPWQQAKDAIAPTLGMTALMAPFGLAGHALNAHRQQQQNTILTAPDADPEQRTAVVNQIAPQLDAVDQTAARNFRANAARAIAAKQPLALDSSLFADPTQPTVNPAVNPADPATQPAGAAPTLAPEDDPSAGTEIGPMAAIAAKVPAMLPMRQEAAQKQAEQRTRETGIEHEVVPHPIKAGMFGVRPVQAEAEDPAAPLAAAAAEAGAPAAPAAPVGLQPGDPVQVTLNGVDQFQNGTRVTGLSPDGAYAQVEGSNAMVPVENLTRIDPAMKAAIDQAASEAATSPSNDRPEPSEAQKRAGNYKKGDGDLQGIPLMIENEAGTTRSGSDNDGTPWSTRMQDHYGYIRGTMGADGDAVDAYIGPNPASHHAFVIDQIDQDTGDFDEHKVMLGYNSPEQAQAAYEAHYAPAWQGGENISATTIDGLKDWLKHGDTTAPFNPNQFRPDQLPNQPAQQAQQPAQQPAHEAPLTEEQLHSLFDQAEAEIAQETKGQQAQPQTDGKPSGGVAPALDDVTKPISYDEARALVAGKTEKPGGVDPVRQIDAGDGNQAKFRIGDVPLSMFKENEAGDLYDGTVNRARAVEYSQRDPNDAPPVIAVVSPTTGQLNILDGGHRLTAARMRGDETIPTIISQKPERSAAAEPAAQQKTGTLEVPTPSDDQFKAGAEKVQQAPYFEMRGRTYHVTSPTVSKDSVWASLALPEGEQAPAGNFGTSLHQFVEHEGQLYESNTIGGGKHRLTPVTLTDTPISAKDWGRQAATAAAAPVAEKAGVPEPQPVGKNSYGKDVFNPTAEQYRAAGEQVMASPYVRVRGAYLKPDRLHDDGQVEARLMHMGTLKLRPQSTGYHRFFLQDGKLVEAGINPGHEGGGRDTVNPDVELLNELPVDAPHPDNAAKFAALDPRVLKALEPGQYGGRLTPERLGGILGDPDQPGTTIGTERAQKALDRLVYAGKVVQDGQSYKLAPAQEQDKPAAIDYPNRKLGFQQAATSEQDAYNDHAWANIAAANMQVGDTFQLNGKQTTVQAITDKTLTLVQAEKDGMDRKKRTLNPDGVAWGQFQRDLGGQLGAENLQANNIMKPARPLIAILQRDPAVHVDAKGSVYLRDGGPVPAAKQETKAEGNPGAKQAGGPSQQFEAYRSHIDKLQADGKLVPVGLLEQIRADERLDDGEAAQLEALAKEKGAEDERPWKDSPFAARIDAVLAKLRQDDPDSVKFFRSGFAMEARQGKLTEETVAFREKKANQIIAEKTGKVTPVPFKPLDAAGLQEITGVAKALPKQIIDAALAKWNPIAEKLAALGYNHGDVDGGKPQAVRELGAQLKEIAQVLMGLAPRRYMAAKGQKVADPAKLAREEDDATRVLGINTRDYPDIDTARQITLGQGVKDKPEAPVVTQDEQVKAPEVTSDNPRGLPNGMWGTVDNPLKFVSGMSRPGDYTKLFEGHRSVGVMVSELSNKDVDQALAEKMAASNGYLFVDSGAFPIYKLNERAFKNALEKGFEDFKGEQVLSFDQILERYERLDRAISEASDGEANDRAFFVMPDVVGRQEESLRLVGQYAGVIKGYGDRAIVPLQSGKLSLTQAYESMMLELARDPDTTPGPVIGIPSAAEAVSNAELTDLLKKHGTRIAGVHVLGAYSEQRLAQRLDAIRAAGYEGNVSADANRLRALMYGDRTRDAAWEELMGQSAPEGGQVDTSKLRAEESAKAAVRKWGFTEETKPADGAFADYETGLKYDNKRSGKEQFSFEVNVAQAPNGKWAVAAGYKQGGGTANGIGQSVTAPAVSSEAYATRQQAIEGGAEIVKQGLMAHLSNAMKFSMVVNRSVKDAADAARVAAPADAKRLVKGFATPDQDAQRIPLQQKIAELQARPTAKLDAEARKSIAREIKAAQQALGKLPLGRVTEAGAVALKGQAKPLDSQNFKDMLAEAANRIRDKHPSDLEAVYAAYRQHHQGKQPLTKEQFSQLLLDQASRDTTPLKGWIGALDVKTRGMVQGALAQLREQSNADLATYQQQAPKQGAIPAGAAHADAYARGQGLATLVNRVNLGDTVSEALIRARMAVSNALGQFRQGDYQVHRSQAAFDKLLEDAGQKISAAAETKAASKVDEKARADDYKLIGTHPDGTEIWRDGTGAWRQRRKDGKVIGEMMSEKFTLGDGLHERYMTALELKGDQNTEAKQEAPAAPEQDGSLAGNAPMDRKRFIEDLNGHDRVQFGEAAFEVRQSKLGRMQAYVVNATFPYHNTVIGAGEHLSRQEAVERAATRAFDWWNNDRVKEAEFARRREKLVRAAQRELFGIFSKDPALMKAVGEGLPGDFSAHAAVAVRDWVAKEKAAGNLDPDRALMLDNIVVNGKPTLPVEWYDSLRKYLKRAAARAEKELDRDPAVYQAELVRAAQAAGIPPDNVVLFKTGFDHALAGKTKSTLPPVAQMQQGYEAGAAWMKTDAGQAWYSGKRANKLENTGVALRRWFDESTRKIKAVTADNLPASYQIIKDQASRVEAFANVAGEGATPGVKRYIQAIRDEIKPFQEWLLDTGPLGNLYGEIGYREADSGKIARFLDGRAYAYQTDAAGKRTSMEDATPQERLELLQEAAATYNGRLRGLAEALSGVTSVAEAAQRFQDYTVKDRESRLWASNRLSQAGDEIHRLMRGPSYQFEPEGRETRAFLKNEAEPDGPANRKQALLVPKLDRVVREGENLPDYRHGENVTPQQMKDTFGFADVGFGRYVAAKQDQDHLNYAFDAFMDLSQLLGIDPKQIGLGGTLHFTVGALGHGRHAAHFQAQQAHPDGGTVPVINVTNTKGDGTVAHEWFHALDHALKAGWVGSTWKQGAAVARVVKLLSSQRNVEAVAKLLPAFVSGNRFMRRGRSNTPLYSTKTEDGLVKNAEHGLQYSAAKLAGTPTDYKQQADVMGEDYWGNERELLARAAESWVHDTLGGTSNYLVNPAWVGEGKIQAPAYKGAPYPMGEERKLFNDAIGALVKALRFGKDGVTVDMDAFDKAFPDQERQYREGIAALHAQIPAMVRAHLAQQEAQQLARQYAKDEAERTQQAAAQAALQATRDAEAAQLREQLEKEQQAPAAAPEGVLSEADLEALFDQAENELAEEQQEQPAAQPPGEPARSDKWTREDLEFLKKSYDAGTVFLLADPSLGLPTIHAMPGDATRHMGYGLFQTKTDQYDVTWDGGSQMKQTPGGQSYTTVNIKDGRGAFLQAIGWDAAKDKLQAKLLVKDGPKAAPTLSQAQEKSAGQLIAEAAKLGVSGLDDTFKALAKLFGGNALKSFPSGFDEHSYAEAKPHFERALAKFQAAGSNIVELFKLLLRHFGAGVRPYAIQFAKEKGLTANLGAPRSSTDQVATQVQDWLGSGQQISSKMLFEAADRAWGGTQAEGRYSVKDAYDAMEAGMNRFIMARRIEPDGSATDAVHKIDQLERWTAQLATQTRRTDEMDEFQQFSTPPAEAFVAAWVAHIRAGEQVLEPSAGTGSLAIYAQQAGARVVANELSARRAEVLKTVLPQAELYQENAEQLDNILPAEVQPGVVLMNPPFSSTAGRMQDARNTMNGAQHIEQALKRLAPGGRLVAIVGTGMSDGKPAFKSWWGKIRQDYNVRVNIGVDGSNYAKYGTTFDNQILVIDKTGPTTGKVVTGAVKSLAELPALLEGIRNERVTDEGQAGAHDARQPDADQPGGGRVPAGENGAGDRTGGADADPLGAGQRDQPGTAGAGPSEPGAHDGAGDGDGRPVGAKKRGQVPDQPGNGGGRGGHGGRTGGAAGRGGSRVPADRVPVQLDGGERTVKGEVQVEHADQAADQSALSDALFENYTPQRLSIPGAKPHPGKLVQSAAMAAVLPPAPTYTPNLPKTVIDKGLLSLAQLEAVVYAGQAHAQMLPGDKERRGYFIGDGTGVGKGREIAGILLDNWRQGRKKAVWLSAKQGLLRDARRDFAGVSGDPALLLAHSKVKASDKIDARQGILFTTYDTLKNGEKAAKDAPASGVKQAVLKTRMDQLVDWLGADFDGVIAFDESHNMGNVLPKKGKRGTTKPAQKALAGVELQRRLPNARIVYVSATGATEVSNLGYATRLGLWGEGSAFAKVTDFIGGIESGGVAAMELVSRDMKAQGSYLARSLSFDGVTYDRLEHELTPLQTDIYNELARAWQGVLSNVNAALEATGQNKNAQAKSAAMAQFWGSHQRFFNHVITAMQMPSILEAAQHDLDAGHAVVMQLVNTNEAEQDRQAAKLAGDDEAAVEGFDFTPRETLLNYVRNSFPVQQHEEYTDENGHKLTRPVVDSQGRPVENRAMVAQRDALVRTLETIRVPDNPLDMILRAFGPDNVAEITGRKRRFIQVPDKKTGGFRVEEQKRPPSAAPADADAFMEDKKRVLVFSDAGGTGYSFQSDLGVNNQRRRMHYLVQPGWRADNAVQGFGRTHRSNEANQPHYVLPTTNLKAQKRFISSIARRLDQLGALTKGQRETGGQGLFAATDNLESQYASDALHNLFVDMYNGQAALDFRETTAALGLNGLIDENTGALNMSKLPTVPQFLNRLLSLETGRQDTVFDEFFRRLEETIERAKSAGTFDAGMETLRADKVEKLRDEVVYQDQRTGAQTRYVELELTHPTHINPFAEVQRHMAAYGDRFLGFYRSEKTGRPFALVRTGTSTEATSGRVVSRGMRLQVTGGARYGDDLDSVLAGARGEKTVKKSITSMLYTPPDGGRLVETYQGANGAARELTSARLADLLLQRGLERVEQTILAGPAGAERDAFLRLLERMRPHLTAQKPAERPVPAFQKLTPDQAQAAWNEEVAATAPTYTDKTHLLTGMLLPIWDRLPGDPRVVRTQTADGERLLGRVVAPSQIDQTLKNLGVGSNLSKLTPATVMERLQGGQRAVLANGWMLRPVRVSNDQRIEVSGSSLAYNRAEQDMLKNLGAFTERINWQERVFIPTGEQGIQMLDKLLKYKPLVDLGKEGAETEGEEAEFSRASTAGPGMSRADVQNTVEQIQAGWLNAPPIEVAQSVADLPFKAPPDTRGASFQGKVYLVADNLAHPGEVQFVLAHEALGHIGLQAILGPQALTRELNRLRMINPALAAAARTQAATYGYDLNLATEEAMADLAGSGQSIKGWQKFVATVQAGLRAIGLDRVADWIEAHTQAETMALLARARAAITGARSPRLFGDLQAARFSDGATSPWFSQLARQIDQLPMKTAPAVQWAETIMGTSLAQKGVRQDEIYWSGVLEYLQGRGREKVTKAELQDYLAENGVRVTETLRGTAAAPTEEGIAARKAVFAKYDERLVALASRMWDPDLTRQEREAAAEQYHDLKAERDGEANEAYMLPADATPQAKYPSYTLPGGENYRELLLTLPEREPSFKLDDYIDTLSDKYGRQVEGNYTRPGWTEADLTPAERAQLAELQAAEQRERDQRAASTFHSTHWDEPNVLAHVRFNDRTDADGKRVLHVEELQSDWGQTGKRDGFESLRRLHDEVRAAAQKNGADAALVDRAFAHIAQEPIDTPQRPTTWAWDLLRQAVGDALDLNRIHDLRNHSHGKVADAPFVGKTEAWLNLALKRVLSYAAENGYDTVSFVTGQQAVDRFQLSAQVRSIEVEHALGEPGYSIQLELLDGSTEHTWATNERELANLLGKELATKALDKLKTDPLGTASFKGEGLKVGGEGMRTFYDKIVPNAINKLSQQLGGGRLDQVDILHSKPYDPEPGVTNYVDEDGQLRYTNHGVLEANYGQSHYYGSLGWSTQPALAISEAMRAQVSRGLPLFSRGDQDNGPLPAAPDPASRRLMAARPAEIARAARATLKAVTVTRLGNGLAHYRALGLQFLGRLQLTDLYGHLFPATVGRNLMQQYSDTASRMDAEKTEGSTRADAVVQRWAKLPDEYALATLMHDTTRAGIDASKPYQYTDDRAQYKALRARWDALTPEAQQIYREAAAAYDSHYAAVQQAIRDRIDRSLKAHPNRASLLSKLEGEWFGSKVKGVYFPLARFGDYLIKVNYVGRAMKDGQGPAREAVEFAETLAEAEARRAALIKEYPREKGFEVMPVIKRAEYNAARDSVSRSFLKKLYAVLDDAGLQDPSLQDTINQLYLTSLPDLSWAKSGIHRGAVAGFSQDARRAFAHHMFHGANYLAKLNHSDRLLDALEGMQKYATAHQAEADYNQVKAQQVIDEMVKRHDAYMNPQSNKLSTLLTSLGFVFYLGASPASALTNLLQTPMVAYPLLAARFGPAKAASALFTASKVAMQGHNDMSQILKGDELAAYQEWVRTGLVDLTMVHDLAGVSAGRDNALHGHARVAMKAASFMFHHAERFNRQATALAAYRLARDAGLDHDEAFRASVDLTKAGHFDYSAGNRPRFMQGPVAQVIFLFKQYAQNLVYTFARNAYLAAKGDRQALGALGGLLVTHALAAGVLGLPLVSALLGAASMFGGGGDDPWDAEVALRRLLADAFGDSAGEVLAHGLSRLTPFDISGRVGANQLIFPDVHEGLAAPDLFNSYLSGLLGPVVGMGVNAAKGMHAIARGDLERGLEMMLPSALGAPLRAGRYLNEGVKDRTGITILPEVNPAEVAGQVLGLAPSRAREAQEVKSAIYERDKALQQRRAQLLDTYASHQVRGDDTADDMDAIRAFNQANPSRVIAGMAMARAVRMRLQHIEQARQGIYLPPKRALGARQAGDFDDGE